MEKGKRSQGYVFPSRFSLFFDSASDPLCHCKSGRTEGEHPDSECADSQERMVPADRYGDFGVGRDLFGYFEGRYTRRLAVVTGIADLLSFICFFFS